MKMNRTLLAVILIGCFFPIASASALDYGNSIALQDAKQALVRDIIGKANMHYEKGEQAYKTGQYDMARRELDYAIDEILNSSIGMSSDDELRIYYRKLIEMINHYQVIAMEQKDGGFSEQRYEPSPLDKLASLSEAELEEVVADDQEINARFNFSFDAAYPVKQFISYF